MQETLIGGIFNGTKQSYIYIWVSKTHKVIYVGMTNSSRGVLGRAAAHVSKKGTLRKKVLNKKGYSVEWIGDFKILSFKLPSKRIFYSLERSYREGVEYLVQKELLRRRGSFNPTFDVISWVRNSPRTSNKEVIREADKIVTLFVKKYNSL